MRKRPLSLPKIKFFSSAYSRRTLALLTAAFLAVVMLTFLATSLASTLKSRAEPEQGKVAGPATSVKATTASGGQAIQFGKTVQSSGTGTSPAAGSASTPNELLGLSNWYLTLPLPGPLTIKQPELANYSKEPYFHLNAAKTAVVFNAPVEGDTTSNSSHTRSELRETDSSGKLPWGWPAGSGSHILTATEAVTHLPSKDGKIGFAQIHGPGSTWYLILMATGNGDGTATLSVKDETGGVTGKVIDDKYVLGTKFDLKISAVNGTVTIDYNGSTKVTASSDLEDSYFKIGAYNQSDGDYGEVEVYSLAVKHQ